jgi:23S rRNA (uridine2552-2'-O)-methyltransferase
MRPGMRVLDLGSAPGGWSQVAAKAVGAKGRVLATDILPMDPVRNVDFIQGDFTSDAVVEQIRTWLGEGKFDLIVSDIAPNLSGIDSADQARSMYFLDLALDAVRQMLAPGATFVAKMFQGQGSDDYVKELRKTFGKVSIRKPKASRPESREVYIVAKEFKPQAVAGDR